jgi:alpha-L-arabinofuranosidase
VNVLNRSEKNDISAQILNVQGKLASSVEVWELNHSDLKTTHTFGSDAKVRPTVKTVQVSVNENGFAHNFPKHSLTILKLRLQ